MSYISLSLYILFIFSVIAMDTTTSSKLLYKKENCSCYYHERKRKNTKKNSRLHHILKYEHDTLDYNQHIDLLMRTTLKTRTSLMRIRREILIKEAYINMYNTLTNYMPKQDIPTYEQALKVLKNIRIYNLTLEMIENKLWCLLVHNK